METIAGPCMSEKGFELVSQIQSAAAADPSFSVEFGFDLEQASAYGYQLPPHEQSLADQRADAGLPDDQAELDAYVFAYWGDPNDRDNYVEFGEDGSTYEVLRGGCMGRSNGR